MRWITGSVYPTGRGRTCEGPHRLYVHSHNPRVAAPAEFALYHLAPTSRTSAQVEDTGGARVAQEAELVVQLLKLERRSRPVPYYLRLQTHILSQQLRAQLQMNTLRAGARAGRTLR